MTDATTEAILAHLLEATRTYIADHVPAGHAPLRDLLPAALDFEPPAPKRLPVADLIAGMASNTAPESGALFEALLAAVPLVQWRRTYTEADGFDDDFLSKYGWFHLASPRGPFRVDGLRVDFGYFGEGLDYRPHWHEPEEIYIAISGEAVVGVEGAGERMLRAGGHLVIPSQRRHWLRTADHAALILGVQWGRDLLAKSKLADV